MLQVRRWRNHEASGRLGQGRLAWVFLAAAADLAGAASCAAGGTHASCILYGGQNLRRDLQPAESNQDGDTFSVLFLLPAGGLQPSRLML